MPATPLRPIEAELRQVPDGTFEQTGRFRHRQFYVQRAPNGAWLRNVPGERKPYEFRYPGG